MVVNSLERIAAGAGSNWIIGTDSNSHSPMWGSPRIDLRGRMLEEFIQKHELHLPNEGDEPTFERLGFTSHIDLTTYKSNVRQRMWGWANVYYIMYTLYCMIRDYFRDRTVKYVYGDIVIIKKITMGCPQGSVLGPLLWNILYDTFLRLEIDSIIKMAYADDIDALFRLMN